MWSGNPFNKPTHVAASPNTGDIFVTDGYGNSRIHKFTAEGEYVLSWGEPGVDPGQFLYPHNVIVDEQDRVYVADRECNRVQVFDSNGRFITMWNNIHRPDGLTIGRDGNFYIGELKSEIVANAPPGLGHRVSIWSPEGKQLARLGLPEEGEETGRFVAPHGIAVDSKHDIYVSETSFSVGGGGSHMDPPRELKSLTKLRRTT
jgi:DNA-binding beta-propeller fold protein YncE